MDTLLYAERSGIFHGEQLVISRLGGKNLSSSSDIHFVSCHLRIFFSHVKDFDLSFSGSY